MSDWEQRDWIVFQAAGAPIPAYTCLAQPTTGPWIVRAADELAAAKVVCGITGAVREYAVLPVAVVDLAANDSDVIADVADTPHRAP